MDERHYYPRRAYEQDPPQRQFNEPPLEFTHTRRPTEPRQRYRATQYEHPMYDEVEDDYYGHSEQLDAFGKPAELFLRCRLTMAQMSTCFNSHCTIGNSRRRKVSRASHWLLPHRGQIKGG